MKNGTLQMVDGLSSVLPTPSLRAIHGSLFLALLLLVAACGRTIGEAPLFTLIPPEKSGVNFANHVEDSDTLNIFTYEYFYDGAGVAVGDVDGNGLPDLYFTANTGPNHLYLNRGDWRFYDVTGEAGVAGPPGGWTTGATMADVNGDGLLDIYVSRSGDLPPGQRRNLLYVNDGDGTFTEEAAAYGIDGAGNTTQAAFFDYDRDGDLDLYVLNHGVSRYERFHVQPLEKRHEPMTADRLYRNDEGRFTDVTEAAGVSDNIPSFGLGVVISDINEDGWPDIFVGNDYAVDDYLYVNNGDGTFNDRIRDYLAHTSFATMGADIADINNDARPDILTLDMLPESNERRKLLRGSTTTNYQTMLRSDDHHQFTRNMLQLNTGVGRFSEIGWLAGVASTDWSWSALLADFDLDGYKDLFVTNGFVRDYTNLDFLHYTIPQALREAHGDSSVAMKLIEQMPRTELSNYLFRNRGDLTFENATERWGIDRPSDSNGAAYADLDNDGDLDLVVSNINQPAFLYRNNASELTDHHYLKIKLYGVGKNRYGLGAKVRLVTPKGRVFYQEQMPTRGYQSSVQPVLVFGLGDADSIHVTVTWPDGAWQALTGVSADQTITLHQQDATQAPRPSSSEAPAADTLSARFAALPDALGLDFVHHENAFVDFRREPLLPHMLSRLGPALATADINADGREDIFIGGARGQAAALYLQQRGGTFRRTPVPAFEAHARYEDVDALFFDADGDGSEDLYVVSGGNDVADGDTLYQDRLYLNDGHGTFTYAVGALPQIASSGGAVAARDYDGDGDEDLFVGGRVLPGKYPYAPRSYLLENVGGRFRDVTPDALRQPGLVTDAAWGDLTGDSTAELVLVGEWMPIRIFRYMGKTFTEITEAAGLGQTNGWWNSLRLADLDSDGDLDLIAGNRGLNAQMQASLDEPVTVNAADFDGNGATEAVISYYTQGRSYPVAVRDELLGQISSLWRKYPTYGSYANATVEDIFSEEQLAKALTRKANTFETSLFENRGGVFAKRPLPIQVQFAPVNSILVQDFDRDGRLDLLLAGNNFAVNPSLGRQDAGRGLFLRGAGELHFQAMSPLQSRFVAGRDVRNLAFVNTAHGAIVLVVNNDGPLQVFAVR
ncbi:MAG TPA: FG-GAP-like repeat-containing protein [Rhodothermales bacterium]|nr:FG-GAP-like repeat-containing protein [Rhodothermales bacterium]